MSSEKKVLHPNLIKSDAELAAVNLAPGTFYFMGPVPINLYQMGVKQELSFFKVDMPSLEQTLTYIEKYLPQMLEDYPPAIRLFFLEEIHEKIHWRVIGAAREQQKEKILKDVKENFERIASEHKTDPLVETLVLKSKVMSEQSKLQLYADNLRLLLQLDHRLKDSVRPDEIATDLILNPENAEFFLEVNSSYRASLVNKPDLIRRMIQQGKPELHRAIREYGLIDTVRFPWRRNELYRVLEAAEKADPSKFILRRYFEASDKGYYARKRKAKYKAEADALPVEFKVAFILENPERADYFFEDEDFKRDLISKRPDLVFKLIELKGKLLSPESDLRYKLLSDAMLDAALKVATFKDIKQLQDLLDEMKWTMERHPSLRLKVDNAAKSAASRDKGKEEDLQNPKPLTAKVEIKNLVQLKAVLDEYKDFTRLEVFLPEGVLTLDANSNGVKVNYYYDRVKISQGFSLGNLFPGARCCHNPVAGSLLQEALQKRVTPDVLPKPIVKLGFMARLKRWLNRKAQPAVQPTKIATSQAELSNEEPVVGSVRVIQRTLANTERSTDSLHSDTQSEDEKIYIFTDEQRKPYIERYKEIRSLYLQKKYDDAAEKISEMCCHISENYPNREERAEIGSEDLINALIEILESVSFNKSDYSMINILSLLYGEDKPYVYHPSSSDIQKFKAAAAAAKISLAEFSSETVSDVDTLVMLEEQFRRFVYQIKLDKQKRKPLFFNQFHYTSEQLAQIRDWQDNYVKTLERVKDDSLGKVLVVKSDLLDFSSTGSVSTARLAALVMFKSDPVVMLEQKFKLGNASLSEITKGISLGGVVSYMLVHPEHALPLLTDKERDLQAELIDEVDSAEITRIIENAMPRLREALRASGIFENEKLRNRASLKAMLEQMVHRDVESLIKMDERKVMQRLENDSAFLDELLASKNSLARLKFQETFPAMLDKFGYKELNTMPSL